MQPPRVCRCLIPDHQIQARTAGMVREVELGSFQYTEHSPDLLPALQGLYPVGGQDLADRYLGVVRPIDQAFVAVDQRPVGRRSPGK